MNTHFVKFEFGYCVVAYQYDNKTVIRRIAKQVKPRSRKRAPESIKSE